MVKRLSLVLLVAQLFIAQAYAGGTSGLTQITAGLGLGLQSGTCGGSTKTNATISICTAPFSDKTTNYSIQNSDGGQIIPYNNTTSATFTLPQATLTGNFAKGWCANVVNKGTGLLTISPTTSGLTGTPTVLGQNGWSSFCSDGVNYIGQGSAGGLSSVTSIGSGLTITSGVLSASGGGGGAPGGSTNAFQYNAGSSTFGGTTIVNNSVLTRGTGTPAEIALTDGQILVGSSSGAPAAANLTAGSNITITNAANSITIAASSSASTNLGSSTSAASPQISGDATTGLYTAGAGKVDVVVGSSKIMEWASTGGSLTGTSTIASTSASALAVGANGATNPVLTVDGSTSSVVTGVAIKGAATAGTTTLTATDSGSNAAITLSSKGTGSSTLSAPSGSVKLTPGSTTYTFNSTNIIMAQSSVGSGVVTKYAISSGAADTGLTASTNAPILTFNSGGVTRTHNTGALTSQIDYSFTGATDAFGGASILTDAISLTALSKSCGTNGTCTNSSAFAHKTQALTGTVTNSYPLNVEADSGATNNYGARLIGQVVNGGATPSIAAGVGAGTSPTVTTTGANNGGVVNITTGTLPTGSNAVIATISFTYPFPNGSSVILFPANAATASITGGATEVYAVGSTTNFVITSGATNLTASTAYSWNYHVVGY